VTASGYREVSPKKHSATVNTPNTTPMVDAPMHARSIALSGRGPNAVMLDWNDGLIVPRGSQLGRATAARSRDALSVGFHQPRLRRDRPTPSDGLSRTAGIFSTPPTSVGYRPDSLNHPLHRSSEHLRAAGLPPKTCQLESMSSAGCVRLASGVARTLGIGMRIAGWGGFLLSILVRFSSFPAERQSSHRRKTYGVRLQPPALDVLACW
jgi:hypothetical protein